MSITIPTLVTFSGYLLLMLLIGFWAYKATDSVDDYILGGRKMGAGVTALSVSASDMSGWVLLGLPGAIYLAGLSEVWIGIGLFVGALLNWLMVAKRLRLYTEQANNALTLPAFFHARFHDQQKILSLLSAAVILLFFTFYTASGMVGGALLFEKVFGFDYSHALIVGAIIITSYTFVGGFFAVSWTDFVQGILMLLALIAVPIVVMTELDQHAVNTVEPDMLVLLPESLTWIGIASLLAWGLGYFGQPHILSRFMAIESTQVIAKSRNIAMLWMFFALVGALAVGLVGHVYFLGNPLPNAETVFIELVQVVFNPWIAGILIAAILSAIMSTIDSQLLVCSSVITEDFYHKWLRPTATQKERLWVGRLAVVAIALIACLLARDPQSSVLGLVSYAWAGFGAAFGPIILLSLFWRNYSLVGAISTLIVGALTVILWKPLQGGIFDLYEILPGFLLATLAGVIGSLVKPVRAQTQQAFDQFHNQLKTNEPLLMSNSVQ